MEPNAVDDGRPPIIHGPSSYSKTSAPVTSPVRARASTVSHGVVERSLKADLSKPRTLAVGTSRGADVFDGSSSESNRREQFQVSSPQDIPEGFDELPIELTSLVDRYDKNSCSVSSF